MSDSPETLILNVDEAADGVRIDKFLSDTLTEYSRSFIQKIIKDELVLANDKHVKSNYKISLYLNVKHLRLNRKIFLLI